MYRLSVIDNVLGKLGFLERKEEKPRMTEHQAILIIQVGGIGLAMWVELCFFYEGPRKGPSRQIARSVYEGNSRHEGSQQAARPRGVRRGGGQNGQA